MGTINGQDGWSSFGPFDHKVAINSYGYAAFGGQSLRLSNAVTSGSFGDQTFSKSLPNEVGESTATNGGMSGGTRRTHFEADWSFASTVPGAEQPGLSVVSSPDRGDGARMSWVQMQDTPTGLQVNFFDYQDVAPYGSVGNELDGCDGADDFQFTAVATGLDRTVPHTIKITLDTVEGPRNDVVKVYVDGVLLHTGTSWEDYFRWCEVSGVSRTVDSILFRTGGAAVPSTLGNGFVIDNLSLRSGLASTQCEAPVCDEGADQCVLAPANEGGACTDGSACTSGDICTAGVCGGAVVDCDDSNQCTDDSCNPATGCVYTNDDTNACSDSSACTLGDACVAGTCEPVAAVICDDSNPCTDDSCNPATGCVYTNDNTNSCTDGNACTNDVCVGGACVCPTTNGACQGSVPLHFDSTDVPKTIPTTAPPNVTTSTLTVSGAGPYLYDLNLKTFITHTSTGQLQITLRSPAGTIVTVSSQNGGTNDNVFNGTLWNDSADPGNQVPFPSNTFAASNLAADTVYTNLLVKASLVPEESLGAFIGENPNGVWTLTIADITNLDGGSLANWSMDVVTLPVSPAAALVSYPSTNVPKTIGPNASVVSSNVTVAGAGTQIGRIRLTTSITHTWDGDMDITLTSPSGKIVTITSDNGGSTDNVFNGTIWDAKADPGNQVPYVVPFAASKVVTDTAYVTLTVKPTLSSEEALAAFIGDDPNGVWTVRISDDATGDSGTLTAWSLEITTTTCSVTQCAVDCNDNNPCTADSCNPATGCVHTNNTAPCNDGLLCTSGDVCSGGSCAGTAINCNDSNVCTNDSCNPATGLCVHGNNTDACDDGNACTTVDVCAGPAVCGSTENFDGVTAPVLPAGWTSTVTGTGNAWVTQNTSSDSAPNSAFWFDGAAVADEVLVSPPIPIVSSSASVTFRNRWSFESATSCFDAGVLEIKIGAGSFTDIVTAGGTFVTGGYTGTVSASFSNPLASRAAWCNASAGYPAYITTTVNLPASAAGQTIQLRWRVGTDTSVVGLGQNIDSLVINDTCAAVCTGGSPVICTASDQCHVVGTCNTGTGICDNPAAPDGTSCSDGSFCTVDACSSGFCTGTPAPAPSTINNSVRIDKTPTNSTITWTDPPGLYDVYRGSRTAAGPFTYNQTCFSSNISGTSTTDTGNPLPGQLLFYLVARVNTCGQSTLGTNSAGTTRPNPNSCALPGDADDDGVPDAVDNCVSAPNTNQADTDADGVGNACDNCPTVSNSDQANADGDSLGDACDPDIDNDGVLNGTDNCVYIYNPDQADLNNNGVGDECEPSRFKRFK